jgi:nucleotidyltransferase substrate binding protein (TIGR01987 family)
MTDVSFYTRSIQTLRKAYQLLISEDQGSISYDMYRSACVKEFEIILEQTGKLLRKRLRPYFHSAKEADQLYFKDLFRHAVHKSLITDEACERWLSYRDNRNSTAHDYGMQFAENTLGLIPFFITDAEQIAEIFKNTPDESED